MGRPHPLSGLEIFPTQFLDELYYATFALWHEASVCRPSVVCNVRAAYSQKVEFFGNIFEPSDTLGTRAVCFKILEKKIEGVLGDHAS